jgi:hypothetical protein
MKRLLMLLSTLLALTSVASPAFAAEPDEKPAADAKKPDAKADAKADAKHGAKAEDKGDADEDLPAKHGVVTYTVDIDLESLAKFDLAQGSVAAEFIMEVHCDKAPCDPHLEIGNGKLTGKPEKISEDELSRKYRIKAELDSFIDLSGYPFDSHELQLELYEKKDPFQTKIKIGEVSQSERLRLPGWEFDDKPRVAIEQQDEAGPVRPLDGHSPPEDAADVQVARPGLLHAAGRRGRSGASPEEHRSPLRGVDGRSRSAGHVPRRSDQQPAFGGLPDAARQVHDGLVRGLPHSHRLQPLDHAIRRGEDRREVGQALQGSSHRRAALHRRSVGGRAVRLSPRIFGDLGPCGALSYSQYAARPARTDLAETSQTQVAGGRGGGRFADRRAAGFFFATTGGTSGNRCVAPRCRSAT